MNSTKELLIKIKDAALHNAIAAKDIPIRDIKDATLAEYYSIINDTEKHQNELLSLYNDIEAISDNETNLDIIMHFLDKMINHLIYLDYLNVHHIPEILPDDISPENQYIHYLELADYYADINQYQTYLCMENAYFYCKNESIRNNILNNMNIYKKENNININKTSIVIVSYNNLYLMQQCIYSIRKHCFKGTYEIVVVDNASTDGVTEWLETQKDIILIKNSTNYGFPKGCNIGISHCNENNDVFLLNNDTRLTPNSLFWLRMGLYDSNDTGATGAVNNYNGTIEYINLPYNSVEDYERFGYVNNQFKEKPFENCTFLCGFAMLIKKQALMQTNLLDEKLSPGYYDDDDISFQLINKGYLLKVCHNSFIYHAGSQSFKKMDLNKVHDIYAKNRKYLTQKWGFSPEDVRVNMDLESHINQLPDDSLHILEINAHNGANYEHLKYIYPDMKYLGMEQNSHYLNCAAKNAPIICCDYMQYDYTPYYKTMDYIIVNDFNLFTDMQKESLQRILAPVIKSTGQILFINKIISEQI